MRASCFLARSTSLATTLLALLGAPAYAADSSLDGAFVTEISPGLTSTSYPTFDSGTGAVNAVALQSDGKILAGGNISRYKTSGDLTAFKRLLATGALDTSFNSGGAGLAATEGQPEVNAILRVAGDKLYVGGVFSSYNGVARSGVLRLNADGSLDTAFDAAGLAGDTRYVMTLAEQPDGKVIVGGGFTNINGTFRRHLARLDANGTLDTAFNANVALANASFVGDVAVLPNGQLVVAGGRARVGGGNVPLLVRLNADGSLDSSLAPSFANEFGDIDELLVLPDGRMLIGGDFSFAPSGADHNFACLLPDGSLDTAFMANVGDGPNGWAGGEIALQPDGTLLVGGIFSSWNGQPRASVARVNQDGTLETSFAPAPYATHGEGYLTHFYSFAVQPDGKFVAGGWLDHVTDPAVETYNLTRFVNEFSSSSAGTLRLLSTTATTAENAGSITLQVSRFGGTAGAVSVQYLLLTGGPGNTASPTTDFTPVSGTLSWAAGEGGFKTITVTLPQDTAVEPAETFTVTLNNPTGGATLPASSAKTVVTIRDDDSAPAITRHPASVSLEQGASFTLSVGYDSVLPTTIQWQRDPDGAGPLGYADIPGATFTTYTVANAIPDTHAGLYRAVLTSTAGSTNSSPATVSVSVPAGSVDLTTFNSNVATAITKALPLGDGRYIAITTTGLVRINANGAVDTTFATVSFSNATSDLVLQPDGKIVVGGFFTNATVNSVAATPSRTGVARFNADGSLDTSFNLNLASNHFVQSLALGAGGKLYVGGTNGTGLKRFTSAGALDTTFSGDGTADNIGTGIPNGHVWGIQELTDGRVLVAHQTGNTFSIAYAFHRLTAAGAVDSTFTAPTLNNNVNGWDFLPDGRIALAGRFTQLDGKPFNGLALIHADGSLGSTFLPVTGSANITSVRYHQGRLFAWGNFTTVGGPSHLARFNLDGSLDTSFSIGAGANGPVTSLHVTAYANSTGDFDVFGSFTQFKGVARAYAARLIGNAHIGALGFVAPRLNAIESGLPLTLTLRRYGPGTEAVSIDYATADAASGTTATAGADYTGATGTVTWAAGDSADKTIAIQLFNDNALEPAETFRVLLSNPSGPATAAASATITLLDDDTPVTFTTQPAGPVSALSAGGSLSITGAVTTSPTPVGYQWFLNGVAIPGATSATFTKSPVSLADAGLYTLVATNAAGAFPSALVHVVIAPQPGRIAPGYATTGRPAFQSGGVQTLLALPDGGALVGGFFGANPSANVPQSYLIRVKADGSVDSSFTLNLGNNVRELLAQPDGKILIAGDFTFVNSVAQRFLYRLNADLTPDTAFNSAVATAINTSFGQPSSIALDSTGRIYLGFNNGSTGSVWRFSSAGVLDEPYTLSSSTVSFGGGVTALAMQANDKLLVAGNFSHIGPFTGSSVAKNRLARVNADGSIDTGFTANLSNMPVSDLLVTATGRIFAAGGTGGGNANLIEVSASDGSTQTGGSSGNQIYEIAFGPDGRLALARAAVNGLNSVSRLNIPVGATTSNDTTFNVGTGPNSDVFTLAYAADGSLWIAGTFSTFDGVASGGILKLQGSVGDPGIVNPPARADVNAGGTAHFAVGAVGTNLAYQWFKNGAPLSNDTRITGATTAILKITGLLASDDDTYAVQVTGGTPSTTVTSAGAKLNVLGAPVIVVNPPASLAPALGSTLTLTADVLAAAPAVYVWKRGETVIVNGGRYSGATTGTLVITGANASDNGAYTLTIVNNQGTASTTPATVTVTQNFTDRDTSTGALGTSSGQVNDVVHLPDGRTLVATNNSFAGANSTNVSSNLVVVAADRSVSAPAAGAFNGAVNKLLRQSDGKILVAGAFTQIGAVARAHIARLNSDLTLDTTFVPPTHTTGGTFNRLALDGQGRVYLGGFFSTYAGQAGLHYFVRLDGVTGALDTSFVASAIGVTNEPGAIVSDSSGRLLIGGDFSTFDSATSTTTFKPLIRLTAAGSLDTGFAPPLGGVGYFTFAIRALAFDDAGRLYVSAQFSGTAGFGPLLVRLLPAGTIDPAFNFDSSSLTQGAYALLPLASGKVLVGGNFTSPAPRLIRVNADGGLDGSFSIGTGFNSGSVTVFAPDAAGRLWVGGSGFNTYQGVAANRLAVLQGEASALSITQQPSGLTRDLGGSASFSVAATANNGFTYQWRKNGNPLSNGGRINGANTATLTITGLVSSDSAAYSVVVSISTASVTSASAGLVVLAEPVIAKDPVSATALFGGSATLSGAATGAATLGYQWLHGTTPLVNGTTGGVTIAGATTSTLTITGATFTQAGEYRLRVTNTHGTATSAPAVLTVEKRPGVLASGPLGTTTANGAVLAILKLQDGSMLVGGQFTSITVNGVSNSRSRLARFLADGTLDPAFTVAVNNTVRALAQDSAGRVFIGGDFTTVGGVSRTRVARLTSALALDTAFDTSTAGPSGGSSSVLALAPVGDGSVYVGGRFTQVGAVTTGVNRMAKLGANGVLDASGFTSYATNDVNTILRLDNGTLYVGGISNTWNTPALPGSPASRLVKLNANGSSRDTGFASPDVFTIVNQVIRLSDGTLFVAGNTFGQPYLKRINASTGADASDPAYTGNVGHSSQVNAIAQQADGKLLSGSLGVFKRTDLAGTADTGFASFNSTISALAEDGSGRIWVGGSFNQYNGVAQGSLAILAGGEFDSRDGLLLPQTITFTDIIDRIFGQGGNTQTLSATSSEGLAPITFSVKSSTPANIATITGNTLTITGAGSITVEAAQAGNATYRAATAEQTFTVAKANQTIENFATLANRTITSPPFELSATATSGLPVVFGVTGVATLGADGKTVTLTGALGTVTVTATQPGNTNYNPAAPGLVTTFEVTAGTPQTITFNPLPSRVAGATFTITNTMAFSDSGLPLTFSVSSVPAGIATVSGNTVTIGSTAGTVTVTASQPGGTRNAVTYAPATPVEQSFNVTLGPPTQTQTITFAQPAALAYGADPVDLEATSSSGLPVVFQLVSTVPATGVATLDDGTLTILGAGKVTIRATCAESHPYKAAPPVTRTITINKADLAVSFDSVSRLVRAANPAFPPRYEGFVNGDTEADLAATRPVGKTTASASSPEGKYPITFTGGLDANYRFVAGAPAFLTVEGFGGAYEALLVDGLGTPRGKLELLVPNNALTYTGTLNLASEPAVIAIRGSLSAGDGASAQATWTRTTAGLAALSLDFEVAGDVLDGELSVNGEPALSIASGSRLFVQALSGKTKLPAPWTGLHTLVLRDPVVLEETDTRALPLGASHASASVAVTGIMTLKGKLADGSTLTTSAKAAHLAPDDEARVGLYRLFVRPHAKRLESFVAGELALTRHPNQTRYAGRFHVSDGEAALVWAKAEADTDKSYRDGFEGRYTAILDPWIAPATKSALVQGVTIPAGTLAQRLDLTATLAEPATVDVAFLLAEGGDLGARGDFLPTSLKLSVAGLFTVPLPPPATANNPAFSLTVTPATGAFTGAFTLRDQVSPPPAKPIERKVTVSGTLRQGPTTADSDTFGHAHFLVDPIPGDTGPASTEQISGELILAPQGWFD